MKKTFIALSAAMLAMSSPVVADEGGPGGFVPPTTGPYSYIAVYQNENGEIAGWDIYYCDGTTDSARFPGKNLWTISIIEGNCLLPLL